jgi:DNA end-binding protein Ku
MPYHLVPAGKTGVEAFAVIREAMKHKRMVALGRLVMSTRERVCAIEIEEDGLILTTLRTAEEVRDMAELPRPELPKPNAQMLAIAEKIIDQQSSKFDPREFTDRYEEALRAVIEEKKKGKPVKPSMPANDDTKVVDLMDALRNSLKGHGPSRERAERFVASKTKGKKKSNRRAA